MGSLRLTTTLQARGPAAAVVLDDEQVAAIGEGAKRFPVAATIGDYTELALSQSRAGGLWSDQSPGWKHLEAMESRDGTRLPH